MRLLPVVALVTGCVFVIAPPAQAAPSTCDTPLPYTASAQADLLNVGLLDLHPLGLNLPKVANLTVASSSAGMATTAAQRSTARAEYLDAAVLGLQLPRGPLEATVTQVAPPGHTEPARNNALAVDLGVASAGTGDLLAHAEWADAMACGTQLGRTGSASATLLEAKVLPGAGGPMVQLSHNLSSVAWTALVPRDGHAAATADAEAGLASIQLLGNSSAAVSIRVIHAPRLVVVATGRAQSSTVDYDSPILEISGPSIPTQRLDAPGRTVDISLPPTVLNTVLSGLTGPHASLLRISLGELDKQVGDRGVSASATSVRLQLLTVDQTSLVDLGVGVLRASAAAPQAVGTVPTGGNPCDTPDCRLPKTGWKITAAVAAGVLLFVLGRFLFVLSGRRRTTSSLHP